MQERETPRLKRKFLSQKATSEWFQGLGFLSWLAMERFYHLEVSQETKTNVQKLKEHLQQGSAIVYFNHICLDDGHLLYSFLLAHLGRSIKSNRRTRIQKTF